MEITAKFLKSGEASLYGYSIFFFFFNGRFIKALGKQPLREPSDLFVKVKKELFS